MRAGDHRSRPSAAIIAAQWRRRSVENHALFSIGAKPNPKNSVAWDFGYSVYAETELLSENKEEKWAGLPR
jgi:hypothetical protein